MTNISSAIRQIKYFGFRMCLAVLLKLFSQGGCLQVQTRDGYTPVEAMSKALDGLIDEIQLIKQSFEVSLHSEELQGCLSALAAEHTQTMWIKYTLAFCIFALPFWQSLLLVALLQLG